MISRLQQRASVVFALTIAALFASALVAMSAPAQRYLAPADLRLDHAGQQLECSSCHQPFRGAPDDKCLKCHEDVAVERQLRRGLHGSTKGSCVNCHSAHDLPSQPALAVDPAGVDHGWTGFDLGRHKRQLCSGCHGAKINQFDGAMAMRCAKCHSALSNRESLPLLSPALALAALTQPRNFDAHLRGAGYECLQCHRGGNRLRHRHDRQSRKFFKSGHGALTCVECHQDDRYDLKSQACETCHSPGHGPDLVDGCQRCHALKKWTPASPDHREKLAGDHIKLDCAQCHRNERYSGLDWKCMSCHENAHPGAYGTKCRACHEQSSWTPAHMDHGAVSGDCRDCHKRPIRHSLGTCSRCHSTKSWKPAIFRHQNNLSGRHLGLRCAACHKSGRYTGVSSSCTSCHTTRHNGGYSRSCTKCHSQSRWKPTAMNHAGVVWACASCHARPGGHYSGNCDQCHTTANWESAVAKHAIQRAGVHPGLGCKACHQNGTYKGLSWTCTSCHRSPHGSNYSSNCLICHNESKWKPASFNHGGSSGDCSACHRAPGNHYTGSCRQCHTTPGSWRSSFSHPKVDEHNSKSFPCSSCHPSGYGSADCSSCHDGDPEEDDD